MVYTSTNGLAPHYLHDLLIRNVEDPSYELRNNATDLQTLKRNTANGQKGSRSGDQNYGTAFNRERVSTIHYKLSKLFIDCVHFAI